MEQYNEKKRKKSNKINKFLLLLVVLLLLANYFKIDLFNWSFSIGENSIEKEEPSNDQDLDIADQEEMFFVKIRIDEHEILFNDAAVELNLLDDKLEEVPVEERKAKLILHKVKQSTYTSVINLLEEYEYTFFETVEE